MAACYGGTCRFRKGPFVAFLTAARDPPDARVEDEMRYAILIYDEGSANPPAQPPSAEESQQMMEAYGRYTQMLHDKGVYLAGEALQPVQTATSVRVEDGRTNTT